VQTRRADAASCMSVIMLCASTGLLCWLTAILLLCLSMRFQRAGMCMGASGLRMVASRSRSATSAAWWRMYIARAFGSGNPDAITRQLSCTIICCTPCMLSYLGTDKQLQALWCRG